MILFDISSAFHMVVHRMSKEFYQGEKLDLKEYKKEFFRGLLWIIDKHTQQFKDFGDPVICIDEKTTPSWRKDMYPMYKSQRKKFRDGQAQFDYSDAFGLFNEFLDACTKSACIKCIEVPGAEADDIILVLGEHLAQKGESVMILSPDKDFIQLQVNPKIKQYSWMTKKMIQAEDKGNMQEWLIDHVCLGDVADAVPRIVDFQEFKPGVKEYLKSKGIEMTPLEFSSTLYNPDEFEQFGGVFETPRFGASGLRKLIAKHGSIEALLESNPVMKSNYERNAKLVLTEGIPPEIKEAILLEYQEPINCDVEEFAETLGLEIADLAEFLKNKYINSGGLGGFFDDW